MQNNSKKMFCLIYTLQFCFSLVLHKLTWQMKFYASLN